MAFRSVKIFLARLRSRWVTRRAQRRAEKAFKLEGQQMRDKAPVCQPGTGIPRLREIMAQRPAAPEPLHIATRRGLFGGMATAALVAGAVLGMAAPASAANTPWLTWPWAANDATGHLHQGSTLLQGQQRPLINGVHVNDFYPPTKNGVAYIPSFGANGGTLAKGSSQKLSVFYGSQGAAAADYPFLTTLGIAYTDAEVDWAAWMACQLYVYERDNGNGGGNIYSRGSYVTSHTITNCNAATRTYGEGTPTAVTATRILYNGVVGNVNVPIPIMHWVNNNELGVAQKQPGSSIAQVSGNVCGYVQGIQFIGKSGNINGVPDNSAYIWGVQVGPSNWFEMYDCGFQGTLWDGFVCTGVSVSHFIKYNFFANIFRDCIQYCAQGGGGQFSTTMHIEENNFGQNTGRYKVLINTFGGSSTGIIRENQFEPTASVSYFKAHPEWFVHGIPAYICITPATLGSVIADNYIENDIDIPFVHLVNAGGARVEQPPVADSPNASLMLSVNIGSVQCTNCTISDGAGGAGTTLVFNGTQSGKVYPGMGVSMAGVTAGTSIVSQLTGPAGGDGTSTWQISAPFLVTTPVTCSVPARTPAAITFQVANGWWDITNTRNYLCGGGGNTAGATVSNLRILGYGNVYTAGGIGSFSGCVFENCFIAKVLDWEVDITKSRLKLAVCQAGTVSTTTFNADPTASGDNGGEPFAVGQTLWAYSNASIGTGPSRSTQTIGSLGTGTGGAGTYGLTPGIAGSAVAQFMYACTLTSKALSALGSISYAINAQAPEISGLTQNSGVVAASQFGAWEKVARAFFDTDSVRSFVWNNAIFWRWGTGTIDGSTASKWNGYKGWTMHALLSDMTAATSNYVNIPMFFANIYDSGGNFVRYVEAAVVRLVKERDGTAPPGSGTYAVGDIYNNSAPSVGKFSSWHNTAGGSPGTWGNAGPIVSTITGGITVSALPAPSAALTGAMAIVTDATAPAVGSTVVGGGGVTCYVWCTGAAGAWKVFAT